MILPPNANIKVLSINVARSNPISHAVLHMAAQPEHKFDLILLQEPWYGAITSNGKVRGPIGSQGWVPILPAKSIPENACPRVMMYSKTGGQLEVTPQSDIIDNLDIMVIDVKRLGCDIPKTRLVNVYNQKLPDADCMLIQALLETPIDFQIPMVIMGDFNLHHPWWSSLATNPSPHACEVVEWLTLNGFNLLNQMDTPTL
jgi:Endonuclease-reverse transcriptase